MNYLPIGAGVIVFLVLASIIGAFHPRTDFGKKFFTFLSFVAILAAYLAYKGTGTLVVPARIHFDNGYNIPYEVVIDYKTRVSISASQVTMVKLPRGNHSIEIFTNGNTFETYQINCTGDRDYIYNIGEMYIYYVVTHTYGDGGFGVSHPSYPHKVGNERFFLMPDVDYGLDQAVPGSITVEASQRSATRTSLERERAVTVEVQTTPTPDEDMTVVVQATPAPGEGEISQFATGATASSQYSEPTWSAMQAIGAPDTADCGDLFSAWASLDSSGKDWLLLTYDQPVIPTRIVIYQTYHPGAVSLVEVMDEAGSSITVYEADPTIVSTCPYMLEVEVKDVNKLVHSIRITIDQSNHNGWNEIDAVQLLGKPK